MGGRWLSWVGLAVLVLSPSWTGLRAAVQSTQIHTFPASAGDTLIVQNDYGRVAIAAGSSQIEAEVRKIASSDAQLANVDTVAQKRGSKIYLQIYFYDYRSESVLIDVKVPDGVNVVVWSANAAVELNGLSGYTRAYTQTGLITAAELSSSTSLTTETGDVVFESWQQPRQDIRLESIRGNIRCRLNPDLNLHGWVRAGGTLSWNREIEFSQGQMEKRLGVGGPLFYAASLQGGVQVDLDLSSAPATDLAGLEMPPRPPSRRIPGASPDSGGRPEVAAPDRTPDLPRSTPRPTSSAPADARPGAADQPTTVTDYETRNDGVVDSGYVLRVDVDWTYLNASVRDRRTNRSVPNLRREDFLVYEDDQLQTVERFESTHAPFNLLLLLDVSGSTSDYIDMIKRASIQFTRLLNPNDRLAVAVFNSRTRLMHPFTNDRYDIALAIQRIQSGGGTAFYDALDISVRDYMDGMEGRNAIVVFTDGEDNRLTGDFEDGSEISFSELFRTVQEADPIIYTIFLDNHERGRRKAQIAAEAKAQLVQIADQTGGRMYSPQSIDDLEYTYQEIADDLRIQYTLAYNSTNPGRDGEWREIRVRIRDRRDLAVRTRRGYYAGGGSGQGSPSSRPSRMPPTIRP